jgi:uncharacterized protein YkwD
LYVYIDGLDNHRMNIFDLIIVLIIGACTWAGYRRGFIFSMLIMASWVAALVVAFLFYRQVGGAILKILPKIGYWSTTLAFMGLLVLAQVCFDRLTDWLLTRLPQRIAHSPLNRLMGILPGFVNGYLWATLLCALLFIYPVDSSFMREVRKSPLAKQLADETAWLNKRLSPALNQALLQFRGGGAATISHERTVTLPFSVSDARPRPELEKQLLQLVNRERRQRGLPPLQANPELTIVARLHSADMLQRGYFSHFTPEGLDPLDRMKQAGIHFFTGGENIAITQTLAMAHTGLMHSTDHRANILNPAFGQLGIGILDAGAYGLMITQAFRN